jgi:HAD superfamily hydrolase (TIGR01509 family)
MSRDYSGWGAECKFPKLPAVDADAAARHHARMTLKAALFDLDGTLLEQGLDFEAIRAEIGLPPVVPILETMYALPADARRRAFAILDRRESEAAAASRVMPGARELLDQLRRRRIRIGILTRNSRVSVDTACRRHGLAFDAVVTREDLRPKPAPDGLHHLMDLFGATADETVMIGDYRYDIEAGRAAGVRTLAIATAPKSWAKDATWVAANLADVGRILEDLVSS